MMRVVREKTISWTESWMQVWSSSEGRGVGDAMSSVAMRCDCLRDVRCVLLCRPTKRYRKEKTTESWLQDRPTL